MQMDHLVVKAQILPSMPTMDFIVQRPILLLLDLVDIFINHVVTKLDIVFIKHHVDSVYVRC